MAKFVKGKSGNPGGRKKVRKISKVTAAERLAPTAAAVIEDTAPEQARAGIEPLDLLLETMRGAWDAAHRKNREAAELDAKAAVELDPAARALLVDKAGGCRAEAGRHVTMAQDMAAKAAPYKHARLAQTDSKVAGELTIVQRVF